MTEQDTPKMTHDEMIDVLKGLVFGTFDRTTAKEREALDMAISALSQQKSLKERMEQLYLEESLKEDLENLIKENERLRNALSENKGEWVACKRELLYFCSECRYYSQNNLFNFCPNCGADMRGE